jgi:single-strand DNA-binding protein
MNDSLSTRGFVATAPNHIRTNEGLPITTFRLATTRRKFNRETSSWENGETNWFTVTAFRQLAMNVATSVSKGDPVVVSGRLSVRDWENGERSGTVVEIDAEAVGHDLAWGSSSFSRTIKPSTEPGREPETANDSDRSEASQEGSP